MTTLSGYDTLNNPDWGDPRLVRLKVPNTPCVFYGRKEVAPYFVAFLIEYVRLIHPLSNRDDVDGYDARPARAGGGRDSDHYGGVAVDVLASGVGEQGSANRAFWVRKQKQVAFLLKKYNLLYWGGDASLGGQYHGKYIDPMHFYLKPGGSIAAVTAEIKRMGIKPDGTTPPPKPLSAHEQHLAHLRTLGLKVPVVAKPAVKPALSAHQLHLQHLANTGQAVPAAPTSGPVWWAKFLKDRKVSNPRVWFALAGRESNFTADCVYPAGAPWGDWKNGNGRPFDCGVLQINVVHGDNIRAMFGPTADQRVMLDPAKCLQYAQSLAKGGFSDWGLKVSPDGQSYSFDWHQYPSDWVTKYAADSQAGFKKWWDLYPTYA